MSLLLGRHARSIPILLGLHIRCRRVQREQQLDRVQIIVFGSEVESGTTVLPRDTPKSSSAGRAYAVVEGVVEHVTYTVGWADS